MFTFQYAKHLSTNAHLQRIGIGENSTRDGADPTPRIGIRPIPANDGGTDIVGKKESDPVTNGQGWN